MDNNRSEVPSEDVSTQKWRTCFERGLTKFGYGALIGGGIAAVLFRRPIPRGLVFGLGMGVAAGISFTDCKYDFENPNKVQVITRIVEK